MDARAALVTAEQLIPATVHDGEPAGYSVAAGGGSFLAGVGYDLPAGWAAVEVPAPDGLARACLTPDTGGEAVLASMRISPELRESSKGVFYAEPTASPTA